MKVIKRDGTVVDFDRTKIEEAIQKAFVAVNERKYAGIDVIVDDIIDSINRATPIPIEVIQDAVEQFLMAENELDVAKAYILYREERSKQRNRRMCRHPDPLALSDYIHYAKYARHLPDKQRRETYIETSHRCRDMHLRRFCNTTAKLSTVDPEVYLDITNNQVEINDLIIWAWEFVDKKIVLPSMRSMQFGGEAIECENTRMYNCSFTHLDRPRVFQEIFYLLLCGCGVGFSVQKQHINKLPIIKQRDNKKLRHYRIDDSIQGWADSIGILMDSFFTGYYVEFDYSSIRPQGSLLKISGGKALSFNNLYSSNLSSGRVIIPLKTTIFFIFTLTFIITHHLLFYYVKNYPNNLHHKNPYYPKLNSSQKILLHPSFFVYYP